MKKYTYLVHMVRDSEYHYSKIVTLDSPMRQEDIIRIQAREYALNVHVLGFYLLADD